MNYDLSPVKAKMQEVKEWLSKEFLTINTGRATPAVLDGVVIDSYGTKVAISHVAAITVEDPRTLRVVPWEKDNMMLIEQAVNEADLGVSVSADDMGLRVSFPELTTERREQFVKIVKERLEDARISVRAEREKIWTDVQEKEKEGELSEDEKFQLKKDIQDLVDETNNALEALAEKKEVDTMS